MNNLKRNKMKNSAVDWFAGEIKGGKLITNQKFEELLQQAKEMEKQNLYNFYIQGGIDCATQADRTVEDYYNKTFKNK